MELLEFLALECPFLLPAARKDPSREGILAALEKATTLTGREADRSLYPGTTAADGAGWTRDAIREQVEGFFRRSELHRAPCWTAARRRGGSCRRAPGLRPCVRSRR